MARREVVCYHEAGHLVVYLVNGIPIEDARIWIFEPWDHPGEWQGGIFDVDTRAIEPLLRIIVTLAAPTTNMRKFGDYFTGDREDLEDAKNFCSAENIDFDEAMQESRRFVDAPDNWAAIERIAHRLLTAQHVKETLQFRQIVEVCGDVVQAWFAER